MDENPYKAPAEHGDNSPDAATMPSRWFSLVFVLFCAGMVALFLLTAVASVVAFAHRSDWRNAVTVLWGLVNATTWCITAFATWTNRRRLRKFALFADLVALLSVVAMA
ncbi:MAG TPA: hypothetical protein VMV10_08175 [Pirellulales bacterium]|nr:hypothetical protein [Pirellulales bacterium]